MMCVSCQDWEQINKMAFLRMIEMYLNKSKLNPNKCVEVLFEAHRCKKNGIPDRLVKAVSEFLEWQLNIGVVSKPEWVAHPLGGNIP